MPKKIVLSDDSTDIRAVTDSVIEYRHRTGTSSSMKMWTGIEATATGGSVTFTLPTGYFTAVHNVQSTVVRAAANPSEYCFAFVKSIALPTVVVQVGKSKSTTVVLGGTIEGIENAPTGITVHLLVVGI